MQLNKDMLVQVIGDLVMDATKELRDENAGLRKRLDELEARELVTGPQGEKGADGKDGKDGVAPDVDELVKAFRKDGIFMGLLEKMIQDNTPEPVAGPEGPQGPQGERGADGEKGDPGQDGKDGLDGKDGRDGVDGEKGADGADVDYNKIVKQIEIEVGHQMKAVAPAEPNQVQIIEAVKAIYPSIRSDIVKALPDIEHKGVHEAGEEYAPGDEVIKGDSTYRAKRVTREAPPHDDWQCIAKSKIGRKGPQGDEGPRGEKGQDGRDGASVDMVEADGVLFFQKGDETVEVDLTKLIADAVAKFMLKGDE